MCISALLIVEPNTIAPFLIISPSFHTSLFPIIRPSGLSVGGIFPVRVILPAWPVWHEELADAATGLPADDLRCSVAWQRRACLAGCSSGDSKTSLMSFRRGQGGHVGRAQQTKLSSSLTQQEVGINMRTHTLASRNLDDGALEWSDKTILLHK